MVFDKDVPAAVAVEIEYRPVGAAALSAAVVAALLARLAQPLVANPYSAADAAGAAPSMDTYTFTRVLPPGAPEGEPGGGRGGAADTAAAAGGRGGVPPPAPPPPPPPPGGGTAGGGALVGFSLRSAALLYSLLLSSL